MFFLQNEEIQNHPRVVKIYGSMIPSAIKKQKSWLEPFKYNYFGETFNQPKKKWEKVQAKGIIIKIYKSIDKKWESFEDILKNFNLLQGSPMGQLQLSFVDAKYKTRQGSHNWMRKTKFLVIKNTKSLI